MQSVFMQHHLVDVGGTAAETVGLEADDDIYVFYVLNLWIKAAANADI